MLWTYEYNSYGVVWVAKHPEATPDMLGFLPTFLREADKRSAREQFDSAYSFAGGWHPFKGHTMLPNGNLAYPGDPPTLLLAEAKLHDETIRLYEHAWVAIIQKDGSYEIYRMD